MVLLFVRSRTNVRMTKVRFNYLLLKLTLEWGCHWWGEIRIFVTYNLRIQNFNKTLNSTMQINMCFVSVYLYIIVFTALKHAYHGLVL